MQVIMFDRQSIFIHGMKIGLQQYIPEIDLFGTCQPEQLWQMLTAHPDALLILDGDMHSEFCCWLLQEKQLRFPQSQVLLTVSDNNKSWLQRAALQCAGHRATRGRFANFRSGDQQRPAGTAPSTGRLANDGGSAG